VGKVEVEAAKRLWLRRVLFVLGTVGLLVVGVTSYMFGLELADWRYQECAGPSLAARPRCWTPLLWFYSGAAEILIALGIPIFVAIKRKILVWKSWTGLIVGTLVATIAGQRWLEQAHKVDSLGAWYTLLCAVLYALPLLSCVAVVALVWSTRRRKSTA
jgi:hypothetical protein